MSRTPSLAEAQKAAREAGEQEEPGPEPRVTPVSLIKIKATEWLWHHRVPLGALTLLPGREGTGKSTAGAWLAAQISRGNSARRL